MRNVARPSPAFRTRTPSSASAPVFDDNVIQFPREETRRPRLHAPPADFKKISQRAYRELPSPRAPGFEQLAHGVGGVAVIANSMTRASRGGRQRRLARRATGWRACAWRFLRALGLQRFAEGGDLGFQALDGRRQRIRSAGEPARSPMPRVSARCAPGQSRRGAFCFALQGGEALFALRGVVAGVAGQREQLHGVAAGVLELPFGAENLFGCRACFVLARLDLLAKLPALLRLPTRGKLWCCARSSVMPANWVRVCSSSIPAAAMRVSSSPTRSVLPRSRQSRPQARRRPGWRGPAPRGLRDRVS